MKRYFPSDNAREQFFNSNRTAYMKAAMDADRQRHEQILDEGLSPRDVLPETMMDEAWPVPMGKPWSKQMKYLKT